MVYSYGYNEERAFLAIFTGWFLAQTIKIIIGVIREPHLAVSAAGRDDQRRQ